jgi:ankyrin repeat protein
MAKQKADTPEIDINTLFFNAVIDDDLEALESIITDPRLDINCLVVDRTDPRFPPVPKAALRHAIDNNSVKTMALLLKHPDIDVNIKGFYNATPLHYAITGSRKEATSLLLEHPDIDVNVRDNHKDTALHYGAMRGGEEVLALLLQNPDIDVNAKNRRNITPLHYAAQRGATKSVELLLERSDIDVNVQDNRDEGRLTALHLATAEVTMQLLEHPDINISLRDSNGRTALHFAVDREDIEKTTLLLTDKRVEISNVREILQSDPPKQFRDLLEQHIRHKTRNPLAKLRAIRKTLGDPARVQRAAESAEEMGSAGAAAETIPAREELTDAMTLSLALKHTCNNSTGLHGAREREQQAWAKLVAKQRLIAEAEVATPAA